MGVLVAILTVPSLAPAGAGPALPAAPSAAPGAGAARPRVLY
ncbi:MAG: hypothetical protein WKF43_17910 [Acidimicrobiales bacterium]